MNAIDQLLLAGHADSSQHGSSHLAELILDEIEPRSMGRREHEDEALWHALQITPRLFGDMRRVVVQHQADFMALRIGTIEFLEKDDEIGAFVRVADGLNDAPAVQIQASQ